MSGAHDEFDILAENLNRMLDRIERLMKGLREVTTAWRMICAHRSRACASGWNSPRRGSLRWARIRARSNAPSADTDQLIGTFNALLLIAETDAGTARGAMSPLDLTSVAGDVNELYEPVAEERGVALALSTASVPMIEGVRSLVAQALANLVDNAINTPRPAERWRFP